VSRVLASEYVEGDNDRYFQGCNIPSLQFSFNAVVSDRDLQYTFYPAFEACVSAGTFSIMCSYNAVNDGVPSCCNKKLLTTQLRDTWKFEGYIVSDQNAVFRYPLFHRNCILYYHQCMQPVTACNIYITYIKIMYHFHTSDQRKVSAYISHITLAQEC